MADTYSVSSDPAMAAMFERAEREGLWFYCAYQDLWFSPERLRQEQADGRFRWGPVNWSLRPHSERVQEAERRVVEAELELERIRGEGSSRG